MIMIRLNLADHYQSSGRHAEARALVQEALRTNPELTTADVFRYGLDSRITDAEPFRDNLSAAGLP